MPSLRARRSRRSSCRAPAWPTCGPTASRRRRREATAGTLRVTFWGGVAPCFVLDRAEVREAPDAVTVTLFAGSDPAQRDAACIEIALSMAVDVPLASPLGGRPVLDGAAGARTSTQGSKSGVD